MDNLGSGYGEGLARLPKLKSYNALLYLPIVFIADIRT